MSALWPLQVGIVGALQAYAPLTDAGWGVYDEPPANDTGPYVVVGDGTEVPRRTLGRQGWEGTETVHLWSQGGTSSVVRQGGHLVRLALTGPDAVLAVDGFSVRAAYEFGGPTLKEVGDQPGAPPWRHVPLRFRFWCRPV